MEKVSNYEKQCEQWRERFLSMDQAALCRKLPELEADEEQLRLWHFGRQFAVGRADGVIRCRTDSRPITYAETMNIYTLFHYCTPGARLTGQWMPFRDLRHASPFAAAFQRGTILPGPSPAMRTCCRGRWSGCGGLPSPAEATSSLPLPVSPCGCISGTPTTSSRPRPTCCLTRAQRISSM